MKPARPLIAVILAAGVAGCASNVKDAATILADRPPQRCDIPDGDRVLTFEGATCDRLADQVVRNQAFAACDGASDRSMCVAVTGLALAAGGGQNRDGGMNELEFLARAMDNDARINMAWISQIPIAGQALQAHYNHKSNESFNDFLSVLAERRGGDIGDLTIDGAEGSSQYLQLFSDRSGFAADDSGINSGKGGQVQQDSDGFQGRAGTSRPLNAPNQEGDFDQQSEGAGVDAFD